MVRKLLAYGAAFGIGAFVGTIYGTKKAVEHFEGQSSEQNEVREQIPDEMWEELPSHVKHMVEEHPEAVEFQSFLGRGGPMHGGPFDGAPDGGHSIGFDEEEDDD